MYYGELCQAHGKEEADEFIKKGKWVRTEDSDGDECFVKKISMEEHEIRHDRTGSVTRNMETDDAGFEKIAQAMGTHFSKKGLCLLRDAPEVAEVGDEDS